LQTLRAHQLCSSIKVYTVGSGGGGSSVDFKSTFSSESAIGGGPSLTILNG